MMFPLILAFSLAQAGAAPLAKSEVFSDNSQWDAIEACPRITIRTGPAAGNGSAVVIAVQGDVAFALTAAHVVKDTKVVELDFFQRNLTASVHTLAGVEVLASAEAPDLALLKITLKPSDPKLRSLKLAQPGVRPKAFSFAALSVGCDEGYSARCVADQVLMKQLINRPSKDVAFFWATQATSVHGRSGGPLLDKDSRVIGICSANQNGLGYFAHTDEIHAWLKQLGYDKLWKE